MVKNSIPVCEHRWVSRMRFQSRKWVKSHFYSYIDDRESWHQMTPPRMCLWLLAPKREVRSVLQVLLIDIPQRHDAPVVLIIWLIWWLHHRNIPHTNAHQSQWKFRNHCTWRWDKCWAVVGFTLPIIKHADGFNFLGLWRYLVTLLVILPSRDLSLRHWKVVPLCLRRHLIIINLS